MEIILNIKILLQRLLLAIVFAIGLFNPIAYAQETIDLI